MTSVLVSSQELWTRTDTRRWQERFADHIAATLRTRTRDVSACEDAMQDLWLGVMRHPPPRVVANDDGRLLPWLIRVARRRLLDRLRREKRGRYEPLVDAVCSAGDDHSESIRRVHAVLAEMARGKGAEAARLLSRRFVDRRSVADLARE